MAKKNVNVNINFKGSGMKKKAMKECMDKNWKWHHHAKGCGAGYFLGFIGAAVYFIGKAATFGAGIVGFLKALVWPAFLVYGLLKYMGL
jgi:hypothetical protein